MAKKTRNPSPEIQELPSTSEEHVATAHLPIWPRPANVSGLYASRIPFGPRPPIPVVPPPIPVPVPPVPGPDPAPELELEAEEAAGEDLALPLPWMREQLRLDVDGRYPQQTASGTLYGGLRTRVHWVARLRPLARDRWIGRIWYRDGDAQALPHSLVTIQVQRSVFPQQQQATATFTGQGVPPRTRTYRYQSPYFHPVDLELDAVERANAVISYPTQAHPNRPPSLPAETLTLERVFERAGFEAATRQGTVALEGAGTDERWSDAEMHDAMQVFWSRHADKPQWALWVLFASLHESGTSLGGIMFDDIGPNHRQGTAIFSDSFIANPPPGDPAAAAWVQRMRFWTAAHEMGHAFNLAHSWQKALGAPWIALANEPEARSFMNYPYNVSGGQGKFFSDFEFRFSDSELLFLRHAPARFVQMGNADWFDDHGFEQADVAPQSRFRLQVRANREKAVFEFLEPVVLELKLTNTSGKPLAIDASALQNPDQLTVVIQPERKPARQWLAYAQRCIEGETTLLQPDQSLYEPVFVSAGRNGFDLAEPGLYRIQVALHLDGEDVVSQPLMLQVTPPAHYEEERLAQDFYTNDVGRVLAFDGSRALDTAVDTLEEVAERLAGRPAAVHAAVAIGEALGRDFKVLDLAGEKRRVRTHKATKEAQELLERTLCSHPQEAAETLGHIDYRYYTERYAVRLSEVGRAEEAVSVTQGLERTLERRGVLPAVLAEVRAHAALLGT